MRNYAFVILIVLAGCSIPYVAGKSYRDLNVPVFSSTRVNISDLEGNWFTIAKYLEHSNLNKLLARSEDRELTKTDLWGKDRCRHDWNFERINNRKILIRDACENATQSFGNIFRILENGRFRPLDRLVKNSPMLLVLWIDEDARTMVLGREDGTIGAILNRTPTLRADRLQAAQEILRFNGYDLSQLRMVPQ